MMRHEADGYLALPTWPDVPADPMTRDTNMEKGDGFSDATAAGDDKFNEDRGDDDDDDDEDEEDDEDGDFYSDEDSDSEDDSDDD